MKSHPSILLYMHSYYSIDLHRGAAQYAQEAGWSLDTSMYRSGRLPNRNWDGAIGTFEENDHFYENFLRPHRIPAVSMTGTKALPCVLPDNPAIGKLASEHLIELGYKNFAFYFSQSKPHEQLRARAFQKSLNPRIHHFSTINHTPAPRTRHQSLAARLSVLKRQLERLPKPLAIMAPLDDLAVEIVHLCLDMGLKVPKDVGVIGVNNDSLICDFAPVGISSVDDDEFKIGYESAALLDRIMRGKRPPRHNVLIPPKGVVIRKSTDLLDITDVPDRCVAIAMRYISENFMNPIDTGTVAHAAGISKRSLQDRFTHNTGRTIHEQIVRKRIDHAKELLRTTDYKTAHVAQECGFGSRERLSKSFKQSTGSSPAEYRDMQTSKRALS